MVCVSTLRAKDIQVHEGIALMDRGIPLPYYIVVGLVGIQELISSESRFLILGVDLSSISVIQLIFFLISPIGYNDFALLSRIPASRSVICLPLCFGIHGFHLAAMRGNLMASLYVVCSSVTTIWITRR